MHATAPGSLQRWKLLFLILEAYAALGCLYGIALRITWRYDIGEHPQVMSVYRVLFAILTPMLWIFLPVLVFLLFVSPLFLKSLRLIALKAWMIGLLGFSCFVWLVFF